MKILHINKFHYLRGGSEAIYFGIARLLETYNHRSIFFSMHHPENLPCKTSKYFMSYIDLNNTNGIISQIKIIGRLLYSFGAKKKIEELIKEEKPALAHLHNIQHHISPSILHSLKKSKIPAVMTLHDYKMACASYLMLNDGNACEACKQDKYYYCFLNGCVKNSKAKSLLNTIEMYLHHKILHIYDLVDIFISPSLFLKNKLDEMGFKKNIEHLPNFINIEDFQPQYNWQEESIVYLGRLSDEKGLFTLIRAIKDIEDITLKLIGEGPLKESLELIISSQGIKNIEFLGYKRGEELKNEIRKSMFLVLPSECYENNPRSIIEGFALGKPAVGAKIGGIPELVKDNLTGLLFEPGNADDLRQKIENLRDNPDKILEMGKNARNLIEKEYTPELYYQKLNKIYESALKRQ